MGKNKFRVAPTEIAAVKAVKAVKADPQPAIYVPTHDEVIAAGYSPEAADRIVVEQTELAEADEASRPSRLLIRSISPAGFRRAGYHFAHDKDTEIDAATLTAEQRAQLELARDNNAIAIRMARD